MSRVLVLDPHLPRIIEGHGGPFFCHQCKVCKHLEIVVISKKKVMEAAQTGRSRAAVAVVAVAAAATTALW